MYVFLLFSSPCPIFQLHMMCPGLAMATVQGEHPSIFSFLSVPLSIFLGGYLAISLSHFLSDYLGLFGGVCRFCPRHTDRFFSGFLETRIFTRATHMPLWGRNAKRFMATTQQKPIRNGKCRSCIWISPFLQISCMCMHSVNCTGTPFSAWQKGKCKRVNRGGGSI